MDNNTEINQYIREKELRHLRVMLDIDSPVLLRRYIEKRIQQLDLRLNHKSK